MDINPITGSIIRAAIAVHKALGPGLLESVYEKCLAIELRKAGHSVQTQVSVPIEYSGEVVSEDGFRIDLLVDDIVIVELKSVELLKTVYSKQLLTYLRLAKKPVGLLINFNVALLKDGIERIANADLSNLGCDPAADRSQLF